ncbi:hypothetical protein C7212DRAFT_200964 [Tuber magnatum]|uniref:Uncharacterized protein n=1 Tax=Tuber magnatum TaxID=42249 RepID=A0A317SLH4_9PEZI|nr:hypothetical protein C7212DRAFT_200964 [Tuber magnatum]
MRYRILNTGSPSVEAVKLFLELEGVNAELQDNKGRTPLSYAAGSGIVEVVRLFLKLEEVNAESQDNHGRTPLFYALRSGSKVIGKILLQFRVVNTHSRALLDDEKVAKLLRECLDTMPATRLHNARAPNPYTDRDDQEAELLVQRPPQLQDTSKGAPPETAQHSSLVTPLTDNRCKGPPIPTQDLRLDPPTPSLAHPALPAVMATGSLEALPQPPRRRFLRGFFRLIFAHISSKWKRPL